MPTASSTNYAANYPSGQIDIVDLQQQVARLQALLETSRQVHSTVRLDELLNTVLRIVVRELELPGALITEPRMSYGSMPAEPCEGCPRFPLKTKDGNLLAELVVAPPTSREPSLYEQDFFGGSGGAGGGGAGKCALSRAQPGVDTGAAGSGSSEADPTQSAAATDAADCGLLHCSPLDSVL
jgi:hypothetical protein